MTRRFVLLVLCISLAGLAGCSILSGTGEPVEGGTATQVEPAPTTDTTTPTEAPHPFEGEALTVAVNGSERERALAEEALAHWEAHPPRHVGFDVAFRVLEPGATETPDVEMRFVDTVTDCGESEYPAGCAPQIEPGSTVDGTVSVQIERGYADDSTVLIVKHEVGHILGADHSDDPQSIMSHQRALATPPQTNATDRLVPFNDSELTIAVDNETVPADERETYREEVAYAIEYVNEGADGTVPDNVTATLVDAPAEADFVVKAAETAPCRQNPGTCVAYEGTDPDLDGAIETYTRVNITLVQIDAEAVSWSVAYEVIDALGADIPDRINDASATQRRGVWHG